MLFAAVGWSKEECPLRKLLSRTGPLPSPRPTSFASAHFLRLGSAVLLIALCASTACAQSSTYNPDSFYVQGNNPWLDVMYMATGITPAAGNTKTATNGNITALMTTLSTSTSTFTASDCLAGPGCTGPVDKSVSVAMYAVPRPALPMTVTFTAGGKIPNSSIVFYRLTEINGNGEGQPSLEGYVKAPSTGGPYLVTINPPTALSSSTAWNVYAAESDIAFPLNTTGTACATLPATTGLCQISTTVVQAITTSGNNMYVGETFAVSGAASGFTNGLFVVASVLNNTTFTYNQAGAAGTPSMTGAITPVLVSGSEVLQSGGGSSVNGCNTTIAITALPTGQATACDINHSWSSSTTVSLKTGQVRPPGLVTSQPVPDNGSCPGDGICQNVTTVTVNTGSPHGMVVGQQFLISGASNSNALVNVKAGTRSLVM